MLVQTPGSSEPVESRGAVVVGEHSVALGLWDLRRSPVNTLLLRKSEIAVDGWGSNGVVVTTSRGGWYLLTEIQPLDEIVRSLTLGLDDSPKPHPG